jgi:pimeloyl-ACP methyl ester carboxylesterase
MTRTTILALPLLLACPPLTYADEPSIPLYPNHANLLVVRDAGGQVRPIKTPADWAVRRAHIAGNLLQVMGPIPGAGRRVPLDVKVVETFDEPAYTRTKITYASEPGDRVPAWLLVPKKPAAGPMPAMLCLHQTTTIGKDEPVGLGGKPHLRYAKELAKRGYVTLSPDYPNFGDYKVDAYALGYQSASMKAIWDNMRAVDLLQARKEVDPARIGVIGHSLGGHNSIYTAVFEPRLAAIVSSCGFNSFPRYMKGNIAGWSHAGYMPRLKTAYELDLKRVPFDFPELIGALAPRPFFTNSPIGDANFEVQGVRDSLEAARPIYSLLGAPDNLVAVHPEAEHDFPDDQRTAAYEFLDRTFKHHSK